MPDPKRSDYEKNCQACHDDGICDNTDDTLVNDHYITSYSSYMRNPSTLTRPGDCASSSFKSTRSPSDAGDRPYSAHVRIKEHLRKSFNANMTRESAHAYVCLFRSDGDN